MIWFYRCGTDPAETTEEDATDSSDKDPPFSYEYDADYIYSAFMQAYGLDLAPASPPLVAVSSAFSIAP